MKSIFFGRPNDISTMYSSSDIQILKERASLFSAAVFAPWNIQRDSDFLKDVDYIFATPSLPVISIIDIGHYFCSLKAIFFAGKPSPEVVRPFLDMGIRAFYDVGSCETEEAHLAYSKIVMASKNYFRIAQSTATASGASMAQEMLKIVPKEKLSVGILGTSNVGLKLVGMLSSSGYNVKHFAPFIGESAKSGTLTEYCGIKQIFSQCDIIVDFFENYNTNEGVISEQFFASMKPNAVFIGECASGHFSEAELAGVLEKRPDLMAVLDNFGNVSQQAAHKLRSLPNASISQFSIGHDETSSVGAKVADTFVKVLYNAHLSNEILSSNIGSIA